MAYEISDFGTVDRNKPVLRRAFDRVAWRSACAGFSRCTSQFRGAPYGNSGDGGAGRLWHRWLVNHRADAGPFKRGVLLFAGHPGILRLREEDGRAIFELRGNFLVRSRRHWLDAETLVVLVDAPSDQWGSFSQGFRRTPRYGADVAALVNLLGERYGVRDWTAVGTSEGSVSAFHAAQMNPTLIRRVILTASVFSASRNGPGLSEVNWSELRQPLLLAHHVDDPCKFTSYRLAEEVAAKTSAPLLTVRGGEGSRGGACEPFTAHGFVGVEVPAIVAMQGWIRTGVAPAEVSAAR